MGRYKKEAFVILISWPYNNAIEVMHLSKPIMSEQEILCALKDSAVGTDATAEILSQIHQENWGRVNQLLQQQRRKLLVDVHQKQDNLYCMDFLLQKLKSLQSESQNYQKGEQS